MIPFVKTFYENNKSSKIYDALNENKYSLQFMIENCPKKIMWPAHLYNTKCTNTIINNYDKIKNPINIFQTINLDLCKIIYENRDKINIKHLIYNPYAINHIEKYILEKSYFFNKKNIDIDTRDIFFNHNAYKIFEKYEEKINWKAFEDDYFTQEYLKNPDAFPFIERNFYRLGSYYIYQNPRSIKWCEKYLYKVDFYHLYNNENVIDFFFEKIDNIFYNKYNIDNLNWSLLLLNENVVKFLLNNNFMYKSNNKLDNFEYIYNQVNKIPKRMFEYYKDGVKTIEEDNIDVSKEIFDKYVIFKYSNKRLGNEIPFKKIKFEINDGVINGLDFLTKLLETDNECFNSLLQSETALPLIEKKYKDKLNYNIFRNNGIFLQGNPGCPAPHPVGC
jgi:hypothetical protein